MKCAIALTFLGGIEAASIIYQPPPEGCNSNCPDGEVEERIAIGWLKGANHRFYFRLDDLYEDSTRAGGGSCYFNIKLSSKLAGSPEPSSTSDQAHSQTVSASQDDITTPYPSSSTSTEPPDSPKTQQKTPSTAATPAQPSHSHRALLPEWCTAILVVTVSFTVALGFFLGYAWFPKYRRKRKKRKSSSGAGSEEKGLPVQEDHQDSSHDLILSPAPVTAPFARRISTPGAFCPTTIRNDLDLKLNGADVLTTLDPWTKPLSTSYYPATMVTIPESTLADTSGSSLPLEVGFHSKPYSSPAFHQSSSPIRVGTMSDLEAVVEQKPNTEAYPASDFIPRTKDNKPLVALFCALHVEASGVELFLDNARAISKDEISEHDPFSYTIGSFNRVTVVVVHLGGIGKGIASTAATHCVRTFPSIKLMMVVGVCGAVPGRSGSTEVILGDVIASTAVVQTDNGTREGNGHFLHWTGLVDLLGRPGIGVASPMGRLQTKLNHKKLQQRMNDLVTKLQERGESMAAYPGTDLDMLVEAGHAHPDPKKTCAEVCRDHLIPRARLQNSNPEPVIHFGPFGSGDQLIKCGRTRDEFAQRWGIKAVEMEVAGVWISGPCIVVKAACDYADSHKMETNLFHEWAAVCAAAAARAIVEALFG